MGCLTARSIRVTCCQDHDKNLEGGVLRGQGRRDFGETACLQGTACLVKARGQWGWWPQLIPLRQIGRTYHIIFGTQHGRCHHTGFDCFYHCLSLPIAHPLVLHNNASLQPRPSARGRDGRALPFNAAMKLPSSTNVVARLACTGHIWNPAVMPGVS